MTSITGKLSRKSPKIKRCLLTLDLDPYIYVKQKHSARIAESSFMKKETINIYNWSQKNHATSQNNEKTNHENKEVEPAQSVHIIIIKVS